MSPSGAPDGFLAGTVHPTASEVTDFQTNEPGKSRKFMAGRVTSPDEVALRAKLAELGQEHRDLDAAIDALQTSGDQLQLGRLKKRKLLLKDEIAKINNSLLPDIIA
ncbi:MAG: DUF465 domain-containing protein [Rhizomicrobium sp.]